MSRRGFLFFAIILIVVILLTLGGYFLVRFFPFPRLAVHDQNGTIAEASSSLIPLPSILTWKTYSKISRLQISTYKISYPADATIYFDKNDSPPDACVAILYGHGFITINDGSIDPCSSTGTGAYDRKVSDTITIGKQQYNATGFVASDNSDSFLDFEIGPMQIEYGVGGAGASSTPLTETEYISTMTDMKSILATFQTPLATTSVATPATQTQSVSTTTLAKADAVKVSDLSVVESMLGIYFQDNGKYPTALGATAEARWLNLNQALKPLGLLSGDLPQDPIKQATGNSYDYETSPNDMYFVLKASMEIQSDKVVPWFLSAKGIIYGLNCNNLNYCLSNTNNP